MDSKGEMKGVITNNGIIGPLIKDESSIMIFLKSSGICSLLVININMVNSHIVDLMIFSRGGQK